MSAERVGQYGFTINASNYFKAHKKINVPVDNYFSEEKVNQDPNDLKAKPGQSTFIFDLGEKTYFTLLDGRKAHTYISASGQKQFTPEAQKMLNNSWEEAVRQTNREMADYRMDQARIRNEKLKPKVKI